MDKTFPYSTKMLVKEAVKYAAEHFSGVENTFPVYINLDRYLRLDWSMAVRGLAGALAGCDEVVVTIEGKEIVAIREEPLSYDELVQEAIAIAERKKNNEQT